MHWKIQKSCSVFSKFLLIMFYKFNKGHNLNHWFGNTLLGYHDICNSLMIYVIVVSDGLDLIYFAFHLQMILYFMWQSAVFYIKFEIILLNVPTWIFSFLWLCKWEKCFLAKKNNCQVLHSSYIPAWFSLNPGESD